MSYHSFSLDPRTVLGVSPDASLDEIREAYRAKSKKHHPDVGGDEWAFRMVTRAYEVLKTTAALRSSQPWDTSVAAGGEKGHAPDWSKVWAQPFRSAGATSKSPGDFHETTSAGDTVSDVDCDDQPETVAQEAVSSRPEPDRFRAVDVELIWTRFEKDRSGTLLTTQEGDDATLSVCMVISWPPHELVDDAADFNSTGDRLRAVIDSFEHMRPLNGVIASRSRIEDGRFVGWLSYLDVPTAQDAFLALRNTFAAQGLTVKLYTRDERIPLDWYGTSHQPVMSQAS